MRIIRWIMGLACTVAFCQGEPVLASLATGDIAFVGFNADGSDGFSFVALSNVEENSTIFFRDDEWSGTSFNSGENVVTWQSGALVVAAGSIVHVSNVASGTILSNVGSTSLSGLGGFGTSNEGLFAYTGVGANSPTTFLSAIFNNTAAGSGSTLAGTGLISGTSAVEFGNNHDVLAYTGPRDNQATFAGYQTLVNNSSLWVSEDGAGDQSGNGSAPDTPFSNVSFSILPAATVSATPEPAALLLSMSSGVAFLIWYWWSQRQAASAAEPR